MVLSVLLLVLDDGTFVAAVAVGAAATVVAVTPAAAFDGPDFLAVSPAVNVVFTFNFSLSLPVSF